MGARFPIRLGALLDAGYPTFAVGGVGSRREVIKCELHEMIGKLLTIVGLCIALAELTFLYHFSFSLKSYLLSAVAMGVGVLFAFAGSVRRKDILFVMRRYIHPQTQVVECPETPAVATRGSGCQIHRRPLKVLASSSRLRHRDPDYLGR